MDIVRADHRCCLTNQIWKTACQVWADMEKVKLLMPVGVVRRAVLALDGDWVELPGTEIQVRLDGTASHSAGLEFRKTPAAERTESQHQPMCGGRSILEMAEEELDAVFERLMSGEGQAEDGLDKGRAEGMARIIAIFRNPYAPDLNMVRAMAVERWEEATLEPEDAESADSA